MPPKKISYRTPSDSTKSTTDTGQRRTSAYDPSFEQNLINHGVYPYGYRHPDGHRPPKPDNWSEINRAMTQPRPSLSFSRFSDGAFEDFERKNMDALNEAEVMTNAFPLIRGNVDIPSATNRPFGNLK
jgi:hypothetical protein